MVGCGASQSRAADNGRVEGAGTLNRPQAAAPAAEKAVGRVEGAGSLNRPQPAMKKGSRQERRKASSRG